jgi:hypothetical protein
MRLRRQRRFNGMARLTRRMIGINTGHLQLVGRSHAIGLRQALDQRSAILVC